MDGDGRGGDRKVGRKMEGEKGRGKGRGRGGE